MEEKNLKKYFCGIDLGGPLKKTTGVCLLEEKENKLFSPKDFSCKVIFLKELLPQLAPYLKEIQVIAIDAPLSFGPGKGRMRLWEKFLSKKIFSQNKIAPLPPVLIKPITEAGIKIVEDLKKENFLKDINLIEVFPTFVLGVCGGLERFVEKISSICQVKIKIPSFKSPHQKSAFVCALIAFLFLRDKTRYLGYKDGFLHLPSFEFWTKEWEEEFKKAWQEKDYLKYRHLKTNLFQ